MAIGVCKLTLERGVYVKSHLVPLAFSAPSDGQYFIDGAPGGRPTRRPTSWYDKELVTRKGEDILAELDSFAADELRKSSLVWSGWDELLGAPVDTFAYPGTEHGVRLVSGLNVLKLRTFFLSLLWRAAASLQPQNAHIRLLDRDLEQLRQMVLNKNPYPLNFMPVQLTQLITRGPRHNLGPLKMSLPLQLEEGESAVRVQTFRFYFDGLVANIYCDISTELHESASAIYVGGHEDILALCIPYEQSFQASNIEQHQYEAITNYPDTMSKLLK